MYAGKTMLEGGEYFPVLRGGICQIYKRNLLEEHHLLFPEQMKYEDNFFYAIAELYVKRVYQMPDYLYHYRENTESTTLSRNVSGHYDRLDIEVMKLQKFQELGVFQRFYQEFELTFLQCYYCNTMTMMLTRFDRPSYQVFLRMQREVKQYFPDYRNNRYIAELEENFGYLLLPLIDAEISEEQFDYVMRAIKEALRQ